MLQRKHILVALKGMAMGAADVVPGVSGGTIAFITGIYQQLLNSIKNFDLALLNELRRGDFSAAWQHVQGSFILPLVCGIGLSILSLAHAISYLLAHHGIALWGFFFGLVFSSGLFLASQVKRWRGLTLGAMLMGIAVAYLFTSMPPMSIAVGPLAVFFAGFVAICAMILPGISGSFLLLLMGMYEPVINAIKELNFWVVGCFGFGAILGLLSFVRILSWLFRYYPQAMFAFLTGMVLGSLNKIWPWKLTMEQIQNRHGEWVPLVQQNVLPHQFSAATGESNLLALVLVLAFFGFALVWLLEYWGNRDASTETQSP